MIRDMGLKISGRSKRNIPLPILKNEPMERTNEYTYYSSGAVCEAYRRFTIEINKKAGMSPTLPSCPTTRL